MTTLDLCCHPYHPCLCVLGTPSLLSFHFLIVFILVSVLFLYSQLYCDVHCMFVQAAFLITVDFEGNIQCIIGDGGSVIHYSVT